jgi:RNA polymerase sigma-70 factor (ECF subfamily)
MDSRGELEALMSAYQNGDRAAAAALIEQLSPPLHRFFLAQTTSRRDADDLLQETWLRIHQVRRTYRPGEPVLPWLYAIARHIRVDHFRRTYRLEAHERQVDELPERAELPHPRSSGPDVEAALRQLPQSQREVIVMLKAGGMSLEEVARATASSVGSVKQKAHRAYEKLRELLEGGER